MKPIPLLNVCQHLKGRPICSSHSGPMMGRVADVIVHPVKGIVMGFVMRTASGDEQLLLAEDVFLYETPGILIVADNALLDMFALHAALRDGMRACRDLLNTEVVDKSGLVLGRITDVYILGDSARIICRITHSLWQHLLGRGMFLLADQRGTWTESADKFVIRTEAMEPYLFRSLPDALAHFRAHLPLSEIPE